MRVTLSLISHTNVGKTTLARTLLRRDVGETRDSAHVTVVNEAYTMIEAEEHELLLWDTPGFGDTARLIKRLRQAEKPMGWFLGKVWDRMADRPLWCSQQAIRNVRDDADIVLYLVDASQDPESAGYIDMEMEILGWLGKPVVVLLNQTGAPSDRENGKGDLDLWNDYLGGVAVVKEVAMLDAFSRCWVQEDALLTRLSHYLPMQKRESYGALVQAWREKNEAALDASVSALSSLLVASCQGGRDMNRGNFMQRLGVGREEIDRAAEVAQKELAEELAVEFAKMTNTLLSIHELSGSATQPLHELAAENFGMPEKVSEPAWGVIGGAAAGASGGLAADILAGGMTAFGGTILGAAGGGLSAYFLARGFNLTGGEGNRIRWTFTHFKEQWRRALLAYLAVAHFGRGRGEWCVGDPPAHWVDAVDTVVEDDVTQLEKLWKSGGLTASSEEDLHSASGELLQAQLSNLLRILYPKSPILGREVGG